MRKLVIALLVLVGLGLAADFAAAAAAEYQVEKQIRAEVGPDSDPAVRINGFPFLTQALVGHYGSIQMRTARVSVGPLRDVSVEAVMRDVDAPLAEVTGGNLSSVRAADVEGRVRIKDTDIGRAIGINDLRIQPASDEEIDQLLPSGAVPERESDNGSQADSQEPGNRAAVRLIATTDIAGARTGIIGIGLIELTGGRVQITTMDVRLSRDDVGEVSLPAGILQPLRQAMSTEVDPGGLPFDVTPTSVWVEHGSFVVEGTAQDVAMSQIGTRVG